jgi:hypothetical protein
MHPVVAAESVKAISQYRIVAKPALLVGSGSI